MIFAKSKESGSSKDPEHDCLDPTDQDAPRLVEPVDGGYGWIIVFASFMCMVIVDGVSFSYSIFNLEIKKHFEVGPSQSAWVGSLLIGCYLVAGPFASMLANKYGCRRITMIGAVISCVAFVLSVFSPNLEMLIVTYGILGGIGFGLIYLPAIVIVGYWFEKKRAFATGITVCGSGIGTFIFPPISVYLLEEYDWRGATAILAGVVLNCAVLGALFRPLEPPKARRMKRGIVQRGLIMKALIEEKKRQRTISNGSLDNCIITKDNRVIKIDQISIKSRNGLFPKIRETLGFSSKSLNKSKNSLILPPGIPVYIENGTITHTNSGPVYRPSSRGTPQRLTAIPPHMRSAMRPQQSSGSTSTAGEEEDNKTAANGNCNVPKAQSYDTIPLSKQWESLTDVPLTKCKKSFSCNSVEHTSVNDHNKVMAGSFVNMPVLACGSTCSSQIRLVRSSRSLYGSQGPRNNLAAGTALVAGSVMSVPQYSASIQSLEYLYADEPSCLYSALQVMKRIFDISLLKSPMFTLLCILSTMSMLGFFIPFMYIQQFAESVDNVNGKDSAFLLSIIGIANTGGRVISGWIADRPWANSLIINNTALVLAGLLTCLVPFCTTYSLLAAFSVCFGICIATFVSLRSILLVDLLGLEQLTNSFGLLILFQGVATMAGTPLAGAVLESTGNVDYSFYMAGVLIMLSGALGYPLRMIKNWEERWRSPPVPEDSVATESFQLESVETDI